MVSFTSGPWTWDGKHRTVRANQQIICTIGDLCLDGQWPEDAANATLIAAAPDLLDFIERWRDEVLGGDHPEAVDGWAREFIGEAGDLLRKAKGGAA
jgi:hypothetical protein